LEQNERGQTQRTAPSGAHGLQVSGQHHWNARQVIQRGCVQKMDCKVAPRTQTHSMGSMFRHIHHLQDRTCRPR